MALTRLNTPDMVPPLKNLSVQGVQGIQGPSGSGTSGSGSGAQGSAGSQGATGSQGPSGGGGGGSQGTQGTIGTLTSVYAGTVYFAAAKSNISTFLVFGFVILVLGVCALYVVRRSCAHTEMGISLLGY